MATYLTRDNDFTFPANHLYSFNKHVTEYTFYHKHLLPLGNGTIIVSYRANF